MPKDVCSCFLREESTLLFRESGLQLSLASSLHMSELITHAPLYLHVHAFFLFLSFFVRLSVCLFGCFLKLYFTWSEVSLSLDHT